MKTIIDNFTGIVTITASVKPYSLEKLEGESRYWLFLNFGCRDDVKAYVSKDIYMAVKENGSGIYDLYCVGITSIEDNSFSIGVIGCSKK